MVMNTFSLQHTLPAFTSVPNFFFDNYMPKANGEFVKIYLYLLRCLTGGSDNLSVSGIADKLTCTETDVMRALRYWEQEKLLSLVFDGSTLTSVSLTTPEEAGQAGRQADTAQAASTLPSVTASRTDTQTATAQTAAALPDAAGHDIPALEEYTPPAKPRYTTAQLNNFMQVDDISQVLYVVQRYLGKTLTPTETHTVLYFYDVLKFPADLIEYLIEYCVSRDKKSMRYIETVALSWAKQGIRTVEDAKDISSFYNKSCFAVMKAFGLSNRNPADAEIAYIRKWTGTMGFPLELILEACSRTIQAIHQPSFEYTDTILARWQEKGVKHLSDIQKLDQVHKDSREVKTVPAQNGSRTFNNRFNNMTPRTYTYDDLEKQLLTSR